MSSIFHDALMLARQGFDTVNSIQGIIIAVIIAMMMRRYGQIVGWSVLATIIHQGISIGRAVMANDPSPLPNLADPNVLQVIAIRFVGYLVMISVFYLLRRVFLR